MPDTDINPDEPHEDVIVKLGGKGAVESKDIRSLPVSDLDITHRKYRPNPYTDFAGPRNLPMVAKSASRSPEVVTALRAEVFSKAKARAQARKDHSRRRIRRTK